MRVTKLVRRGFDQLRPAPRAPRPVRDPADATCRQRARSWVHAYAAGGAAFAFVPIPIPGSTTAGLVALEVTMVHAISRIYGNELTAKDAAALVAGLEVAGGALKTVAREGTILVPAVGWLIRGGIAAASIEAIGHAVIELFEKRHPGQRIAAAQNRAEIVVTGNADATST